MDQNASNQLEKILAMADSAHDGEAVVAVRKARQIMSRDGLSFGDLARVASSGRLKTRPFSFFSGNQMYLETQIVQLRQKLDDAQDELQAQAADASYWRRRAVELEENLAERLSESLRWRQLARETVELLMRLNPAENAENPQKNTATVANP
jgi:hypothetical protein